MRWFVEQGNFAEDEACQQVLLKKPRLRIVWAVVHLHEKNAPYRIILQAGTMVSPTVVVRFEWN